MKCQKCYIDLPEPLIQLSHDVPCYLFEGNRKGQKNQADKFKTRWVCEKCHKEYESALRKFLQKQAEQFGGEWFDSI